MDISMKKMILRKGLLLAGIAACLAGAIYFANKKTTIYSQACLFSSMSTMAAVQVYSPDKDGMEEAVSDVQAVFAKVETVCNRFNPESELSKLNDSAYDKPFACSPELWQILGEARKYYKMSDGAFDVTVSPLMKLWGFHNRSESLPAPEEIAGTLQLVGLDKVQFDDQAHTVRFTVKGMAIDLGGIAKGWALDLAAAKLREHGVRAACIDLGGNVRCLQKAPPNKSSYTAGVKNPFCKEDYFASTELLDQAIATSGNYERFRIINGKQYTHIVNPKTGYPVENMLSVSVTAPTGVESDALSTALFVNGRAFAEKLIRERKDLRFLMLSLNPDRPGKVEMIHSKGWDILFTPASNAQKETVRDTQTVTDGNKVSQ